MIVFIQTWEKKQWKKELSHRVNSINHVKLTKMIFHFEQIFFFFFIYNTVKQLERGN